MIGAFPFFKRQPVRSQVFTPEDARRARAINDIRNNGVRQIDGNPRFGFQTILPEVKVPLPTAPAIVGGNVDWTRRKVSPSTQYLHSFLSEKRMMRPVPALETPLKLEEPNNNSIHTTL